MCGHRRECVNSFRQPHKIEKERLKAGSSEREDPTPQVLKNSPDQEAGVVILVWDSEDVRRAFIKKVFCLLIVMLSIVTAMGSVAIFSTFVRRFLQVHWYLSILAWIPFLIVYFMLVCCSNMRRQYPLNIILLSILTLLMGIVLMCNCAVAHPAYVVLIFLVTTLSCIGIVIFAMTPMRTNGWQFILFAALLSLIIYTIGAVIISILYPWSFFKIIICGISCVIFMTFLAIDARSIIQGRQRGLTVQPDEVIYGALVLFVDIVYIFLCFLGVGGE